MNKHKKYQKFENRLTQQTKIMLHAKKDTLYLFLTGKTLLNSFFIFLNFRILLIFYQLHLWFDYSDFI